MTTTATTTPLRITGATLIDGTGGAPVADAVVETAADGTVRYAGPADRAPAADPAARTVHAPGRTLLPGFIDSHVHFGVASSAAMTRRYLADPVVEVFDTADRLRATLHAGITSARDLGGLPAGYREAVASGRTDGPRLKTAVRILSHTAGHADLTTRCGFDPSGGLGEIVDTEDEARIAVRRLLRDGADLIKLCATGGMGSPHDQPTDEGLTEAEIRAVVGELARHGGRPVAAHAQGTAGIINAVRGGVTSVEHGYGLTDEAIDLVGEHGTYVVPTLSTVFDGLDKATMAPFHYQKKLRWQGITKENIARAIERGVKIAMGTDAAMVPHGRNLRELMHLTTLGMSPMDAVTAATRTAAELLGTADLVGTVQAGKLADLVLLDGDPLADIAVAADPANVQVVLQGGAVKKDTAGLVAEAPAAAAASAGGAP